jgi:hypothetical protein
MSFPVARHAARWARHRLLVWVMFGGGQRWPGKRFFCFVVPEPILAWLEAADDGMARGLGVLGGVLAGGRVAAADVATAGASPQVEPPPAGCEALDAAGPAGRHRRIDPIIWHGLSLQCWQVAFQDQVARATGTFGQGMPYLPLSVWIAADDRFSRAPNHAAEPWASQRHRSGDTRGEG